MNKKYIFFYIFLVSFYFSASSQKLSFRDTLDNAIDISEFLKKNYGFLPFIVPITEPAIGYGGVAGGLYFLPKKDNSQPSDIIAAAGGLTSNGTWLAGGGYLGFWKNDQIRYRAVIGYGDVSLKYYVFGKDLNLDFNLKAFMLVQQIKFRIKESDFFIGGKYQLSQIKISDLWDIDIPEVKPNDFDMLNSSVSLITEYDNLNSFFSPSTGLKVHLSYDQNLEFLGSDQNWGLLNFFAFYYQEVNTKWNAAFRIESQLSTGETPFYANPFVYLRGIPAMRYQGELTMLAETEQTYNITSRWSLLGFTGVGTAFKTLDNLNINNVVWNAGGGFRYLIARLHGIKVGTDIARGPEDWAFYVVIGSSWLK